MLSSASTRNGSLWLAWMLLCLWSRSCLQQIAAVSPDAVGRRIQGSNYPYDSIGVVQHADDQLHAPCTASLIGLNYVVTAADCVSEESVGQAIFLTGGIMDKSQAKRNESIATVTKIHRQSDFWLTTSFSNLTTVQTRSKDNDHPSPTLMPASAIDDLYAILELDALLGALHGIFFLPSEEQMGPIQRQIQLEMDAAVPVGGFVSIGCTCRYTPNKTTVTHNCDLSDFTNISLTYGDPMFTRNPTQPAYILSIFTPTKDLQSDKQDFEGVVGTMIRQHLLFLQNPAALDSPNNTNSLVPAHSQETSSNSSSNRSQDSLNPSSQQTASTAGEISPHQTKHIQATVAYTCFGVILVAWMTIVLFVVIRQWRRA